MKIQNNYGNILITFVFALGIAIFSMSYYYNRQFFFQKINYNKLLYLKSFESLRSSSINLLYSQVAYVKTVTDPLNGDLDKCLRDSTYLCPTGTRPLFLYKDDSIAGAPWLSMNSNDGLDLNLSSCKTFPSFDCPFKFSLTWSSDCDAGLTSCNLPSVVINGSLSIDSKVPFQAFFNSSRVQFEMRLK